MVVKKYSKHYSKNGKSLLTAKEVGLNAEETEELLIPFGNIYEDLARLVDVSSVTDVVAGLEGTVYSEILEDVLQDYEAKQMILPLEAALDKFYLENILRTSANPSDDNELMVHTYIGSQVDAINLKIILRSKVDGLTFGDISPYMISNGYQIRDWKLKDLMESEDVESVISALDGTDYAPILNEALTKYLETGSLDQFEKSLDAYLTQTAKNFALKKPFGVGPMLGFINRKENEIKNLKIIARAKREEGFTVAQVKEMLV